MLLIVRGWVRPPKIDTVCVELGRANGSRHSTLGSGRLGGGVAPTSLPPPASVDLQSREASLHASKAEKLVCGTFAPRYRTPCPSSFPERSLSTRNRLLRLHPVPSQIQDFSDSCCSRHKHPAISLTGSQENRHHP